MRIKTILSNCISNLIKTNNYIKFYIYGSNNLEIEKIISTCTSSPIIGGDVDLYNNLLGKFFCNKNNDEILDQIIFELINKTYTKHNSHNKRLLGNILDNSDAVFEKVRKQIQRSSLCLNGLVETELKNFLELIEDNSLLIIDNRNNKVPNKSIENLLLNYEKDFILLTSKDINNFKSIQFLKYENINIYSKVKMSLTPMFFENKTKKVKQKFFETLTDGEINDIKIKQLTKQQFNVLREQYLSKHIRILGTPMVSYGLFSGNKIFGVLGLTNDYRNKPPQDLEQPCIYLLSDFAVASNIKKLSKLVLYCALSK